MSFGNMESTRSRQVAQFWLGEVFERAEVLESEGADLIHLEVGRTSFDTPAHIKEAAKDALDAGMVHYTPDQGSIDLRRAVAAHLQRSRGLRYNPDDEILITVGASEALFLVMAAYLGDGDNLLVPSPGYPTYYHLPALFGATPEPIPCPDAAGFQPAQVQFQDAPLMIVNSPNNPTGAVWSESSLKQLAGYAREQDMIVLSDEIYGEVVFDEAHLSIAQLPEMQSRSIILGGVSKAYSMTGWRVGFAAGPRDLLWPVMKLHQHNTVCAPSFAQVGATAAITGDQQVVREMVSELRRRRDAFISSIRGIPGFKCHWPAGTFYAFPDVSEFGIPSEDLALHLVEQAGVVTVPGSLFGPHGEGHLRLSFAGSSEELARGAERIRRAVKDLLPRRGSRGC